MNSNPTEAPKGDILIVDDTPISLHLLSIMLTEQGYKVRCVINGQMALMAVQAAPPDLILLDITMPKMSGYEVCSLLKANPQTKEIPVIFISALDDVLDKVKAFSVGGVDYITKPFHLEEVLARVENQLTIRRLQKQLQEQNARLQQEIIQRQRFEGALQEANKELKRLAHLDGLTQIPNRRRFDECLRQEWRRLRREQAPLSLILCDVDYFKRYNDAYGHQAGDDCLKQVARAISRVLKRPADLVARYGGEEFAAILPNTNAQGAFFVAEAMRSEVQSLKIAHAQSEVSEYVSLSLGVTSIVPTAEFSLEALIDVTDQALYEAKQQGRNRTVVKTFSPSFTK